MIIFLLIIFDFVFLIGNYSSTLPGDDWFILEPIRLNAGYYSLKFWYASMGGYQERFAVYYGTEATPEAMTNLIVKYDPFLSDEYSESANVIHIEEDGVYYLGFHAFSDVNMNVICIDDISIEEIEKPKNDLSVVNILSPVNGYVSSLQSQDISFSVVNSGVEEITGINRATRLWGNTRSSSSTNGTSVGCWNIAGEGTKRPAYDDFQVQATGTSYWTRSANSYSATSFCCVSNSGNVNYISVNISNGVRLGFKLG